MLVSLGPCVCSSTRTLEYGCMAAFVKFLRRKRWSGSQALPSLHWLGIAFLTPHQTPPHLTQRPPKRTSTTSEWVYCLERIEEVTDWGRRLGAQARLPVPTLVLGHHTAECNARWDGGHGPTRSLPLPTLPLVCLSHFLPAR